MTIHASKGLEYPIVILASCGQKDMNDERSHIFSYEGHLVASSSKVGSSFLDEELKARGEAEAKRLLYVGITRAKNHLVVSGVFSLNKNGSLQASGHGTFFNSYLNAIGLTVLDQSLSVNIAGLKLCRIEPAALPYTTRSDECLVALEKAALKAEEKTFLSRPLSAKPSLAVESEGEEIIELEAIPSDSLLATSDASAAFGTLVHSYLERCVKNEDVESVFDAPLAKENARVRKDIEKLGGNFLSSALYAHLKDKKLYSEYRFFYYSEEEDLVYEGVIDLLADCGGYNLLVDYKSDRTKSKSKHKSQLMTYIRAAEKLFGKPCYATLFYLREKENDAVWDRDGKTVVLD